MVQTLRRKNGSFLKRPHDSKLTTRQPCRNQIPPTSLTTLTTTTTPTPTTTPYIVGLRYITPPPAYCVDQDLKKYQRSRALRAKAWSFLWIVNSSDIDVFTGYRLKRCRPDCRWMKDESDWKNFQCPDECVAGYKETYCRPNEPDHGGQILPTSLTLLFAFLIPFL